MINGARTEGSWGFFKAYVGAMFGATRQFVESAATSFALDVAQRFMDTRMARLDVAIVAKREALMAEIAKAESRWLRKGIAWDVESKGLQFGMRGAFRNSFACLRIAPILGRRLVPVAGWVLALKDIGCQIAEEIGMVQSPSPDEFAETWKDPNRNYRHVEINGTFKIQRGLQILWDDSPFRPRTRTAPGYDIESHPRAYLSERGLRYVFSDGVLLDYGDEVIGPESRFLLPAYMTSRLPELPNSFPLDGIDVADPYACARDPFYFRSDPYFKGHRKPLSREKGVFGVPIVMDPNKPFNPVDLMFGPGYDPYKWDAVFQKWARWRDLSATRWFRWTLPEDIEHPNGPKVSYMWWRDMEGNEHRVFNSRWETVYEPAVDFAGFARAAAGALTESSGDREPATRLRGERN
jgi:hypothetical protein